MRLSNKIIKNKRTSISSPPNKISSPRPLALTHNNKSFREDTQITLTELYNFTSTCNNTSPSCYSDFTLSSCSYLRSSVTSKILLHSEIPYSKRNNETFKKYFINHKILPKPVYVTDKTKIGRKRRFCIFF